MTRARLSPKRRLSIFEANGGICHLCGCKIIAGEKWEVDHVRPISMGGEDAGENLKPAHKSCHAAKTLAEAPIRAKAKRMKAKHFGIRKPSKFPASRNGKWKQKVGGVSVLRDEE